MAYSTSTPTWACSTAVRELAIVLGIAVLASTCAAHAGYDSPTAFIDGFRPAVGAGDRARCRRSARRSARSAIDAETNRAEMAPMHAIHQGSTGGRPGVRRLAAVAGQPLT